MYYIQAGEQQNDRIGMAVFFAAVAHALVILGVSFDIGDDRAVPRQLDVTLATQRATQTPDEAEFIAQADQTGSGDEADQTRVSSIEQSPLTSETLNDMATRKPPVEASERSDRTVVDTRSEAMQSAVSMEQRESQNDPSIGTSPELDRLSQDIASLQARLDQQNEAYSRMPRVRRLTAASAKAASDAAYLHHWRSRVEAIGNQYYPEASLRYGIYGSLQLLVVVRKDGGLEDIEVLRSSGHAVLDEAAIKIVRMAAPFAAFPDELAATTDKLEIVRTWQFRENGLSSG